MASKLSSMRVDNLVFFFNADGKFFLLHVLNTPLL